ncbi:MAG: hypothetical protein ACKODX_05710 [Gemmata sp.]
MSADPRPTFLFRLARRPLPVLLGLAVGFLGCSIAGRVAARQQPYKEFVRFHPGIGPDAHYYPTYSQTYNLARQHVQPGKALVVIGGHSVLQGVGQRPQFIWSKRLQELLGPDFVVLNLAMRGGYSHEFAAVIVERLIAERVPVIFVAGAPEGFSVECDLDGLKHRDFFWDAWGKGHIRPDEARDKWLTEGFYTRHAKAEPILEHRRRGRVDAVSYSQDLWNYVAYKYRGTVWTPLKYPEFWQPHRLALDIDPGETLPWEVCNGPAQEPARLRQLRGVIAAGHGYLARTGQYAALGSIYKEFLPTTLHSRTLSVFRPHGTYYRARLTPEERAQYEDIYRRYPDALRTVGLHSQVIGMNYEERDYFDHSHLSERGGRKMAEELAPTIRAMNAKLYGPKPTPEGVKP